MDAIIRTNSGAPLITPWSARGMSNDKYNILAKADDKKHTIESVASKAFDSPVMKAADKDKAFIKQKIEAIKERLKILRKLYSGNPKEMAKALTQIFKDLKAALKEYKAATDKEIGASAGVVEAIMPADVPMTPPAADAATPADDAKDQPAAPADPVADPAGDPATQTTTQAADPIAAPSADQAPTDPATAATANDDKHALYGQIEEKVKTMAGEDGLDFTKEIKGLVQWIEDKMLTPARIQMKAKKPDKDTDKAFEDVDKQLKELKQEMEDVERDIKREAPAVGQHLDVAA